MQPVCQGRLRVTFRFRHGTRCGTSVESIAYILAGSAGSPVAAGRAGAVAILMTTVGAFLRFVTEIVTP
jgi:hypothetical protein